MNRTALSAIAIVLVGAASHSANARTAPQDPPASTRPASDLTRDLNSGPPTIAEYLARPATPASAPAATPTAPAPRPATPAAATTRPAPAAAAPAPSQPAPTAPAPTRPAPTPAPARPAAATTPAAPPTTAPPATTRSAPTPAPALTTRPAAPPPAAPVTTPAPAPGPVVTVLDAAARASLPFTVDLPQGFEIVTGRPGPDFRIFTIRRAGKSFAMVYVGPASQFPIYSGEMIETTGRASVVTTEDGQRRAVEHMFQRPDSEIHVWTMSLEGADRALAERIAQSVDVR